MELDCRSVLWNRCHVVSVIAHRSINGDLPVSHWLTITVILIVCITLLAWFFSEEDSRMLIAYIALRIAMAFALFAWSAYVLIHFIVKYW